MNLPGYIVCPVTHETLHWVGDQLVTSSGRHGYPVSASGIPLFAEQPTTDWTVGLPFLRHAGLQVVGAAVKPGRGQ